MHFHPLQIHVLLQNDSYVRKLEQDLKEATTLAEQLKLQNTKLQTDYANLSLVYIEVLELLKVNGFKYRKGLDGVAQWIMGK